MEDFASSVFDRELFVIISKGKVSFRQMIDDKRWKMQQKKAWN